MTAEMYLPTFVVKQKLTMMVNRYEVLESDEAGNPGRLMGRLPCRSRGRRRPRRTHGPLMSTTMRIAVRGTADSDGRIVR